MARPLKAGMDYFPHDTDASNDEKVEAIRALHGNDGYAFYFILCERIYRAPGAELDISKKAVEASLIKKVGVTPDKFKEILQTAFEVELFCQQAYEERNVLTSKGIKKRAGEVQALRERWRKQKDIHTENPVENGEENAEETPERKEKKRKEKESKDHNNNDNAREDESYPQDGQQDSQQVTPVSQIVLPDKNIFLDYQQQVEQDMATLRAGREPPEPEAPPGLDEYPEALKEFA